MLSDCERENGACVREYYSKGSSEKSFTKLESKIFTLSLPPFSSCFIYMQIL